MIITLGTLNPNHSIFSKSHKPEVINRATQNEIQISNEDGFFTGLPKLTSWVIWKSRQAHASPRKKSFRSGWRRKRRRWGEANKTLTIFRKRWRKWISRKWVKGRSNKKWTIWKAFSVKNEVVGMRGSANAATNSRIAEPAVVRGECTTLLSKWRVSKVYWHKPSILKSDLARGNPN